MADSLKMALLESRLVAPAGQNQVISTDNGFLDRSNSVSNSALFESGTDLNIALPIDMNNNANNSEVKESPSPSLASERGGRGKRKETSDSNGSDDSGNTRVTRKSKQASGDSASSGSRGSASGSASTNVYQKIYRTDSASLSLPEKEKAPLSRKRSVDSNSQKSIKSYWPNNDVSGFSAGGSSEQTSIPSSSLEYSDFGPSSVPKKASPQQRKAKGGGRAPTPPTNPKLPASKANASLQPVVTHHQPIPNGISQGQRIQQLELQLDERRRENDARVAQLQQRLTEVTQDAEQWKTQSKIVIEKLVRERAEVTAEDIRQRHSVDSHRLGKFVLQRISSMSGSGISEYWEDGRAMREVKDAQGAMLAREEAIKKLNRDKIKAARDVAKSTKNKMSNSMPEESMEELLVHEAEESAKARLAVLKRDQVRLADDRAKLERETLVYRREVKRCALEDRSKFKRGSRTGANGEYVLISLLGKGGFSEVWKAFDLGRLKDVAVKVHQLSDSWGEEKKASYTKHATREYCIHKDLSHPHVVKLYDVFEINSNAFATVLEACEGGDLDQRLKSEKILSEGDAKPILLQVIAGLRYLNTPNTSSHTRAIIHYDLKPGNILFDERGDAKITDFGLSKIVDGSHDESEIELTSQGTGTYWYLPPECFRISAPGNGGPRISSKVDVWSLGVIFYQMLFGKRPFGEGQSQEQLLRNNTMLSAGVPEFPDKPKVSTMAKEFLKRCLCADQSMRPDVLDLCRDPYLRAPSKNKSSSSY